MSNKVLFKKSSVSGKIPLTTDLDYGEIALNYADGRIYYKTSSNTINSFAAPTYVNEFSYSSTGITTQTAVYTFPIATYRGAEYFFQITNGTFYQVVKVMVVHDGTNVVSSEAYTDDIQIQTGTQNTSFTFDINSGNLRLLVTASSGSATIKGSARLLVL